MYFTTAYDEYTSKFGKKYDPWQEYSAIMANVQDPNLRASLLGTRSERDPGFRDFVSRYVEPSGGVSSNYFFDRGGIARPQPATPPMTIPAVNYPQRSVDPMFGRPMAQPGYNAEPDPNIPSIDFNTGKVTYPTAMTTGPSRLASQESGAIGAASIASQMGAKPIASTFANAATNKAKPKPKPYTVQRGDTLSQIAKKNKMSLSQLMKLNPKFKQQAKYQGGRTIFSGTKVNLAPKPAPKKKPAKSFSPAQFRMAEERSMQQPAPTLQNPLQSNQGGFR
jgi:LysM repeat protein